MEQGSLELAKPAEPFLSASDMSERVIAAIAKEHHVLLSKDDPILLYMTACVMLVREQSREVSAAVRQSQDETVAGAAVHVENARRLFETLVQEGGRHMADQVKRSSLSAMEDVRGEWLATLEPFRKDMNDAIRSAHSAKRVWQVSMIAALFAVGGAAVCLVALLAAN